MIWMTLLPSLRDLGGPLLSAVNTFQLQSTGAQPLPRSAYCVTRTDNCMGYATGRLFVDKYFSKDARSEV